MGKKVSILKTIDIDKLYNDVNKYICETGERNPYLFMSYETMDAIAKEVMEPYMKKDRRVVCTTRNGLVAEYCGYKVFSNNELKFGEVELR